VAGKSGQTCDEIRANFVLSYSKATPTGADLHKLERIIPKRCSVRCDTKGTNREIGLFGGMSFRLPRKAKKETICRVSVFMNFRATCDLEENPTI